MRSEVASVPTDASVRTEFTLADLVAVGKQAVWALSVREIRVFSDLTSASVTSAFDGLDHLS